MKIALIIGIIAVIAFLLIFIILFLTGTSEKGIEKSLTKMGNAASRAQANVIRNNKEIMKETADNMADINKDAVETIAHAIKDGFKDEK